MAELEEVNLSLELRAEEAEGNLAAAQSEAETIGQDRDSTLSALKAEHQERLASMEASQLAEVRIKQWMLSLITSLCQQSAAICALD